jgi:hypothetical protein
LLALTDSTPYKVEAKAYDMPAGATWDAFLAFYNTELAKTGWTPAKQQVAANPPTQATGWELGNQTQMFTPYFTPDVGFILALYTKK